MLEVVTDVGPGWKVETDWEILAQDAVAAAIGQTPHAEFAAMPSTASTAPPSTSWPWSSRA